MGDEHSYDTLHEALLGNLYDQAKYPRIKALRNVIEKGANVNSCDSEGDTALLLAARRGFTDCVSLLLDAGADVNQSDNFKRTPLINAAFHRDVECVRVLLDAGANVNDVDNDGRTALMTATGHRGDKCVELLLKYCDDVDHTNHDGNTSLMQAAELGNSECIKSLLEAGVIVNKTNKKGETALMKAAFSKDIKSLRMLLDAGADVNKSNKDGETALTCILTFYDYRVVTFDYKDTAEACLKMIIDAGADIDVQTKKYAHPIFYAFSILHVFPKYFPAHYLLSENCNLSQLFYPKTEWHRWYESQRLDVLKLLLACGLPRHVCQSYIIEQESYTEHWIKTVTSEPNTLKTICVFEIRKNLGRGIKSKVSKLNIPNGIQNQILLKGILYSECFN